MKNDCVGKIFVAKVVRVEAYGVYLEFSYGEILVLIPDVSYERVPDLTKKYVAGDNVRVKIVEYIEDRQIFTGTIKDADAGPGR